MKHRNLILRLFLLFYALSFKVSAQTYNFQRPAFNDWIPPKVYCVIQDKKGYYWLGSPEGLTRIDGTIVTNYSILDGMAEGGVRSILEDQDGNIWFGHLNGGLTRFNGQYFEKASFDSLVISSDVTSITKSDDGLWITTVADGAVLLEFPVKDIKHIKSRQFTGGEGLSDQVYGSELTRSGDYICMGDVGLRRFNKKANRFESYILPNLNPQIFITCMDEDKDGNIWLGTYNHGLIKYIKTEARTENINIPSLEAKDNWVTSLTEDSRGRLWVGTWTGGVALIDRGSLTEFKESNGLKARSIYGIIEDAEGNILIVDRNNGLTVYKGDAIVSFNEESILPGLNVYSIIGDKKGAIWFGTNGGISKYDPGSDRRSKIFRNPDNSFNKEVRFLKEDINGNIWAGSNQSGVIMYNQKTSLFESQPLINSVIFEGNQGSQVTAIEIDRKNNLWIGTSGGLVTGTIGKDNFASYNLLDSIRVSNITALYCDPSNTVWIGTEPRGNNPVLLSFDINNRYKAASVMPQVLQRSFATDNNGNLVIGTPNAGIFNYDHKKTVKPYNLPDIIHSSLVSDIKVNKNNDIYIATQVGLYVYNPVSDMLLYLSEQEGICDDGINCIYFDDNGFAWLGTRNGVSRLSTDLSLYLKASPNPILRKVEINAKEVNPDSVFILKNYQNNLSFMFGFTGFTDPLTVSYHAMLEGLNKNWVDYGNSSKIGFPPLPPGKYKLKVRTTNIMGFSSKTPFVITFSILPPWWKTMFAKICYIILAIAGLFLFYRIKQRKLILEKIALEKAVQDRTKEIEIQKEEIKGQRDKITDQRDLLMSQNDLIASQQKDLTDSINYAARIQSSLIPHEEFFRGILSDYFIFYKPRDIVSGDFYWFDFQDSTAVVVGADCTGHGVPGALLSMLGITFLDDIVKLEHILSPNLIIDRLRERIIEAFKHSADGNEMHDGMDIAVVSIDFKQSVINYAGAKNSLFVIKNGSLIEVKANREPVSFSGAMSPFTNHSIKVEKGDSFYIFSDGFPDQFGGPDGKKYKYSRFRKLIESLNSKPMAEQRLMLDSEFENWKGNNSQIDDILIIGIKI